MFRSTFCADKGLGFLEENLILCEVDCEILVTLFASICHNSPLFGTLCHHSRLHVHIHDSSLIGVSRHPRIVRLYWIMQLYIIIPISAVVHFPSCPSFLHCLFLHCLPQCRNNNKTVLIILTCVLCCS